MTAMTNWTTFASAGERVTTWNYNTNRGWLEKKVHPGETDSTADYEYKASGRLLKRLWERGATTTYADSPREIKAGVDLRIWM